MWFVFMTIPPPPPFSLIYIKLRNATKCTKVAIDRIELFTGGAVIYIQNTVEMMVDMFKVQSI